MDVAKFKTLPVLGILRGGDRDSIAGIVESAIEGGLETLEVTMNTRDAPALIGRAIEVAAGQLTIGAGTVLSLADLDAALGAGATFVVMPTLVREIVDECVRREVPVFPGALTPQEIHDAWRAGATMVKVFPAKVFGPAYFREIKGPFDQIELLACGGVDASNLAKFIDCGASAVAFGGSIFRSEWLADAQFDRIQKEIRTLIDAYRAAGTV